MAFLRAVVWGVPLLLLLLAAAVVAARGRVAHIGGLDVPYPDANGDVAANDDVSDPLIEPHPAEPVD